YEGQGYELHVPIDPGERDPATITEAFHRRYEQAYGYRDAQHAVEIVTWHVSLVRPSATRSATKHVGGNGASADRSRRRAYFPETGLLQVEVHDRGDLRVGRLLDGPCLVAETTTTTVVLPGDRVEMTDDGSLLVHIRAGE